VLSRRLVDRYNVAMRTSSTPGSARAYIGEFRSRVAAHPNQWQDPFTINPIRRSLVGASVGFAVVVGPFLVSEELGATVMLAVGWLALAMIVFCLPILIWSIAEEAVRRLTSRVYPPVSELELPARVIHILQRHGVRTIRAAERLDPAAFHLMANMAPRDADAVRRAIRLWRYRRWQEAGFPTGDGD
jgi:hypothetical protein